MSDPGIKLFGKTIALPLTGEGGGNDLVHKVSPPPDETKDKVQDAPKPEEKPEPAVASTTADGTQKPSDGDDDQTAKEQPSDSSNLQEKPLKKPDKILPCPRCNSMDTKFCYFNNYNVNQPRHFCKNCQRYWTAGGTMRNVPVGAGRRKNKNSAYRHLTVSDITPQPNLMTNGTVFSFGSDTPICESMVSVLNLSDRTRVNCNRNEEQSTGSSATTASNSNSVDEGNGANLQQPMIQNYQGFGARLPYVNGLPWPYPWSPPPPIQFYPAAAYWGCSNWGMPWISPQLPPPSPILNTGSSGSGPLSPTLGKHSREGNVLAKDNSSNSTDKGEGAKGGNLWIPKTLRIDDPEEAAKSSIWATMGFKNDKDDGIRSRGGLFKPFEPKAELDSHKGDANSQVFRANPAALSRSINFQESS